MGEMADMANERACDEEAKLDEYLGGGMSDYEAYDAGILDESGSVIGLEDRHFDRMVIGTRSELDTQLWMETQKLANHYAPSPVGRHSARSGLNAEAQKNLKKLVPTCNVCRKLMTKRDGRFGAFYFCRCPNQPTVSDSYWQKTRIK